MTPIMWGKPGKNILSVIFYINVKIVDAKCQVQHSRDIKQIISAAISRYLIFSPKQRSQLTIFTHPEVTTKKSMKFQGFLM